MRECTVDERRANRVRALPCVLGIALLIAAGAGPTGAAEFEIGEARVHVDTTLSVGASMRVHGRDCRLIDPGEPEGCADPFNGFSNSDDGNLNYDKWDVFSNMYKATVDVDLAWRNFGGFFRSTLFYDLVAMEVDTDRTDLAHDARYRASPINSGVVGMGFQVLDAYLYGNFEVAGRPLDIRIGNQVLSWGESLFFQRGVSSINTVDLNRLRAPGSQLKEAFLPAPMVRVSTEIFPNFGIEAFYQMYWNRTELDPAGSYYTDNVFNQDVVGRAGKATFFGPDSATTGQSLEEMFSEYQFAPDPIVTPLVPPTGSPEGDFFATISTNLGYPPNVLVFAPVPKAIPRLSDEKPSSQGQWGVALRYFAEAIRTEFGLYYLRIHDKNPSVGFVSDLVAGAPPYITFLDIDSFAPSMRSFLPTDPTLTTRAVPVGYFREYPEGINIFGASAATEFFGIAWGAEVSYSTRLPVSTGQSALEDALLSGEPTRASGFLREKKLQAQLNAIATIGPGDPYVGAIVRLLRISSIAATFEVAVVEFPSMSDDDADRLEPPATRSHVDELSWGYQALVQGFYDNPFGVPVTVTPRLGFQHDVDGNTPGRYPFIEDRKAFSAGVNVDYLGVWQFDLSYTNWYGAGLANGLHDRDWVSMSLTHSF